MNTVFLDALIRHLAGPGTWRLLKRLGRYSSDISHGSGACFVAPSTIRACRSTTVTRRSGRRDDIYYNGGGTAIGSAYNAYLNRQASRIAELPGKDPKPYRDEADAIEAAMRRYLWLPDRGAFGEYKDVLGRRMVHRSAGLWSYYHVIDSQVSKEDPRDGPSAARCCACRAFPSKVPTCLRTGGTPCMRRPNGCLTTGPSTTVVMAENLHAALALWQTDRPDAAWQLTKSTLLASMFMGISPGNVGTMNFLDVYRREAQRDFADGVGVMSRAMVEGLFGIRPDALNGTLHIVPGLDRRMASREHPSQQR